MAGSGLPVTTQNNIAEKMRAMPMRMTFKVTLPMRLLPISLSNAVAVHEKATPIDIISPRNCIVVLN